MSTLTIRREEAADRGQIASLIAKTYLADGVNIIEVTSALRDEAGENSLGIVGAVDGKAVIYALFTPTQVADSKTDAVLLTPFAFDVSYAESGLEGFMDQALEVVAGEGYTHVLALGNIVDMQADGYMLAESLNINLDKDAGASLLVKPLKETTSLSGTVHLPSCVL